MLATMRALLPADGPLGGADELGVTDRVDELWEMLPTERARFDLDRLLAIMSTPAGGMLLYGRAQAFDRLADPGRALRAMSRHRLGVVRQGFQALKRLTAFVAATASAESPPPLWSEIGYPGPDPTPATGEPLAAEAARPGRISTDVVIVGSGAGGGVAAGVLADAGLRVVVLEKGEQVPPSAMVHEELAAYRDMYMEHGMAATANGAVALLAGSVLGGGTTVNWTTSFPTPSTVLDEWDRVSGLEGTFTGDELAASTTAVMERLAVTDDAGEPSSTDVIMETGLRALGWHVAPQPRNVIDCVPATCGYCGMGCRIGAKQGTAQTYLADAVAGGATLLTGADVRQVLLEAGKAVGVRAEVAGGELIVDAASVIVAAGALHTPSVLRRSGVRSALLGRMLRLHPVTVVWGRFAEPVDPWSGMMQSRYSDEFADLDGAGYGFRLETGPAHPALLGVMFGWSDGHAFQQLFAEYRHWSPVGILLRDSGGGHVRTHRDGTTTWAYRLGRRDRAHVRVGVRSAARVLAAAGAEEVMSSTAAPVTWNPSEDVDAFMAAVDHIGYGPNQTSYLSFHQMGSARVGLSSDLGVIDGDHQVHDVPGLFVMDSSAFPTASGVNPMISIQALAHRAATRLAGRLA